MVGTTLLDLPSRNLFSGGAPGSSTVEVKYIKRRASYSQLVLNQRLLSMVGSIKVLYS